MEKVFESSLEAEEAFYDAIRRADVAGLMEIWADDEDVVCVHPGAPRLIGRASIRAAWESIFARGGVDIRPVQVHVHHHTQASIHNVIEEVQRSISHRPDLHILATNVYIHTHKGWRILTHHASVVPGEAPVEQSPSSLLH